MTYARKAGSVNPDQDFFPGGEGHRASGFGLGGGLGSPGGPPARSFDRPQGHESPPWPRASDELAALLGGQRGAANPHSWRPFGRGGAVVGDLAAPEDVGALVASDGVKGDPGGGAGAGGLHVEAHPLGDLSAGEAVRRLVVKERQKLYSTLTPEQRYLFDQTPDAPHYAANKRTRPKLTPRLAQIRMWGGAGILPPHVRRNFSVTIAAVLSRIVRVVEDKGSCRWSKARLAASVGCCARTVQRAFVAIYNGEVPGLKLERDVCRGPNTATNTITFATAKSGTRLKKWISFNPWGGRLFDLPQEIHSILKTAIAAETDPRLPIEPCGSPVAQPP